MDQYNDYLFEIYSEEKDEVSNCMECEKELINDQKGFCSEDCFDASMI